jgi:choline dehydrogenase
MGRTQSLHAEIGAPHPIVGGQGPMRAFENDPTGFEPGGSDRSVLIQMPAALSIPMNMPKYDWGFATETEPHLGGRRLATPRGKVLGGSSSINGMVWVRGNPLDFDAWEEQGAEGWGYRHVLPYFRRADAHEGGDPQYHNSDGPLHNRYGRLDNPLHHAWLEAARQAGYPATSDHNGYQRTRQRFRPPECPSFP